MMENGCSARRPTMKGETLVPSGISVDRRAYPMKCFGYAEAIHRFTHF